MEGSSPTASVKGTHVAVQGPFAPGHTYVQVASRMPLGNGELPISAGVPRQPRGAGGGREKSRIDDAGVAAGGAAARHPVGRGDVHRWSGRPVAAGSQIDLTISGYPHHSAAPRFVALSLAVVIAVVGAFMLGRPDEQPAGRAAERKRLISRREKLFSISSVSSRTSGPGRGDAKALRDAARGDPERASSRPTATSKLTTRPCRKPTAPGSRLRSRLRSARSGRLERVRRRLRFRSTARCFSTLRAGAGRSRTSR